MSTLVPGTYNARGVDAQLGMASTGSEQVAVELEITDEGFAGQRITWFGYFTEQTQQRTFESLRLLGWEGDDLSDLRGIDRNPVRVVLENDTYDNKTRLKVRWINGPGGIALKTPLTGDQARAFAARMKAAAVASRLGGGGSGGGNGRSAGFREAPPPDDSDIPF